MIDMSINISILEIIYITGLLLGLFLMWKVPNFKKASVLQSGLDKVTILIPARNEEKRIEPLLKSIQACKFKGELIVIDDHSEDKTSEIALSYGAKVIPSKPLPRGFRGKSWALYQGREIAKYDVLMLVDADTYFVDNGIDKIISEYLKDSMPLSVQPYHEVKRPYEHLSVLFNTIIVMASNIYTPFQKRFKPRVFYGPIQVMSKRDYDRVALNKNVNQSVLDDIEMGKVFLEEGLNVGALVGKGAVHFRMYPGGFKESVFGWSKSFATGAILIGVFNMIMISLFITGVFGSFFRPLITLETLYLNEIILYFLTGLTVYFIGQKVGSFSLLSILLYPFQALYFVLVFMVSLYQTLFKKKVSWRGRDIDLEK